MTLQDAHSDSPQPAFSAFPVTPGDVAEMPTNPLMPSLSPANFVPITPITTTGASGTFANSEIIVTAPTTPIDPLARQAQPDASTTAPATFANSEIIVTQPASPMNPLSGPPLAPMLPPFPLILPTPSKRLDLKAMLAICAALLLFMVSVGGLIFNFAYYQPYRVHSAATATAIVAPTSTVHADQTQIASAEQTIVAQEQATTTAYQNIYTQSTRSRPFLNESLKSQSSSGWDEGQLSDNSSCNFKNGHYEVYEPDNNYYLPCIAENPVFTNFAFQVNMTIIHGESGGIFFRGDSNSYSGYSFLIDSAGNYELDKASDKVQVILSGQTSLYKQGQANQMAVVAIGTTYYFYLNQNYLNSITDKTFGEGQIGVVAYDYQDTTTVAYNNLKVWLLP